MKLVDLSQVIESNMPVYPGDDNVILEQCNFYKTDKYNNHRLETGMHVGTHIDGAMHMQDISRYISEYDLNTFYGQACVIDARGQQVIGFKPEYSYIIKENSIVLIYTGMDKYYGLEQYYTNHPVVELSLCKEFVKKKVKMVGIDMPSPDKMPFQIHKYLLDKNILIIENLRNLDRLLGDGNFDVMAFPLNITADSSLVRVVAKVE